MAEFRKNLVLILCFLGTTACSVYGSIKCIVFNFHSEKVQGTLLCVAISLCNLEYYLLQKAATNLTKNKGVVVANLHHHQ